MPSSADIECDQLLDPDPHPSQEALDPKLATELRVKSVMGF
jgi:hypothetical protein